MTEQSKVTPVEAQADQPVAWMWQHEETGMTGFVQHAPEDELRQWERMNRPRKIVAPLFTRPTPAAADLHQQSHSDAQRLAECLRVLRPAVRGKWPHEQALEELAKRALVAASPAAAAPQQRNEEPQPLHAWPEGNKQ